MGLALISFRLRAALLESGWSHEYLTEADELAAVVAKVQRVREHPLHAHLIEEHMS